MADENQTPVAETAAPDAASAPEAAPAPDQRGPRGGRGGGGGGRDNRGGGNRGRRDDRRGGPKGDDGGEELIEKLVHINRVSKTVKGGKDRKSVCRERV